MSEQASPANISGPEPSFVQRAKQASEEAKAALSEFEVKDDGAGRNFFNEPLDSDRPSFGERAAAASEQGKGAAEHCRQQLGS